LRPIAKSLIFSISAIVSIDRSPVYEEKAGTAYKNGSIVIAAFYLRV